MAIMEFETWLVEYYGVNPDLAEEMHDWAYQFGAEGLQVLGDTEHLGEFDGYEMVSCYRRWQNEVGERTDG